MARRKQNIISRLSKIQIKKRTWIALWIIALVLPISIKLFFKPNQAEADWWNPAWIYRQVLTISNSGSNISAERKIKIDLDTASLITAGKLQSDCDDLRFTNQNGQLLDYFINTDVAGCNDASTDVYVKVSEVLAGEQNIYIYYGNLSVDNTGGTKKNLFFAEGTEGQGLLGYWKLDEQVSGNAQSVTDYAYTNDGTTSDANSAGMDCTIDGTLSYGCSFDGTDDYIQFPSMASIRSISMFVYINSGQESGSWDYLLDARSGLAGGWFSDYSVGTNWTVMYVNGESKTPSWSNVPKDQWVHLYVQSNTAFTDDVTLMARYGQTESAQGKVDDLRFYSRTLTSSEINSIYNNGSGKAIATPATFTPNSSSFSSEQTSTAGPIAYWKFDEGSGTTAHDSAGNNNGTITGATWVSEDQCVSGKCLQFNGSSNYIDSNYSKSYSISESFSWSAWVKTGSTTEGCFMGTVKENGANDPGVIMCLGTGGTSADNNKFRIFIRDDAGNNTGVSDGLYSSTDINDNRWHHLSLVRDVGSDQIIIYVDGVQNNQIADPTTNSISMSGEDIFIGGQNNRGSLGLPFHGYIDEVKIYPFAISEDQVKQDYNNGLAVSLGNKDTGPLSDGLVGYWKMDEASWNGTSGEVLDASGNGNHGTSANGTTTGVGKYGNGGSFDGTDDDVSITDASYAFDSYTQFSYGAWVYPTTNNSDATIMGDWTSSSTGTMIYINSNNTPDCRLNGNSQIATSSVSLVTNQWAHVFCTWEENNLKIYINGSLTGSTNATTIDDGGDLKFGEHGSGGQYQGNIDEARLYNRALSAREVTDLYHYAPGPVGYWKMDEGSGTTANDSSGNGLNGTLFNSLNWSIGKFGKGIAPNSDNQYISISDSNLIDPMDGSMTWSTWFKTSETGRGIMYRKSDTSNANGILIDIGNSTTGQLKCWLNLSPTVYVVSTSSTYNDDSWHYLSCVYDVENEQLIMYIDGKKDNSSSTTTLTGTTLNASSGAKIGSDGSHALNGNLDEVKIYNYARTPQQIVQDMNAGHPTGGSPVGSQLAYWKFDEGYGQTAHDQLGNNDGTLGSNTTSENTDPTWSNGKFNKALYFDGTDDYVDLNGDSAFNTTDARTVSVWAYFDSSSSNDYHVVASKRNDNKGYSEGWSMEIHSDGTFRTYHTGGQEVSGTITNYKDGWHQYSHVFDGSTLYLYFDGGLINSVTASPPNSNPDVSLFLGNYEHIYNQRSWMGKIDEVKLYSSALTEEQIKIDYNAGLSTGYGVAGPSEASILDDGAGNPPIAEWNFDENTGSTANDSSGNGNTGTITGASWKGGCKMGNCLNFSGVDDDSYVSIPSTATQLKQQFSEITTEAWVYPTSFVAASYGPTVISNTDGHGWAMRVRDGYLFADFRLSDGTISSVVGSTQLTLNTWNHISLTYDGSSIKGYINGNNIGSINASGTMNNTNNSSACTFIGHEPTVCSPDGLSQFDFPGLIDQVKIYDYARTPAQIAYDYNRGKPVAHYKLDECQGTTIYEQSGSGLNGTLTIGGSGTQTSAGTCSTSGAWANGATGKYNASMNFDGTDDYIIISNPADGSLDFGTGDFSFSTWIKTNDNGNNTWILDKGYDTGNTTRYLFGLYNGKPGIFMNGWTNSDSNISTGVWTHIVGVRDNDNAYLYIDGKLDKTGTGYASFSGTNSDELTIGARSDQTTVFFNGQIDDVRIYNYALSADQILKVYNGGSAVYFGDK